MNILFVDDQENLRLLYRMGLAQKGHHVLTASGGMEALLAVQQRSFDIIVMDMEMPHMSGWETAQKICKLSFGKKANIVIFTSGTVTLSPAQIHRCGVIGILNKPMTPTELLSHVSQFLDH